MSAVLKIPLPVSCVPTFEFSILHFAFVAYFFFSAFHIVRDTALPQKGQKLMGYKRGRSSGERSA